MALARVINSTFSGNSASDSGGGFFNYFQATSSVTNSTFSANSAIHGGGGLYNFTSATLTVKNTLLAGSSSGGNCFNDGVLSSGHYNLSDDNS